MTKPARSYLQWFIIPRRHRINGQLVRPYGAKLVEVVRGTDTPAGFYHNEGDIKAPLPKWRK